MRTCRLDMLVICKMKEVPVEGDAASGYSVSSLDKPTTRLSQYARGKTGSMNPFKPGGEVRVFPSMQGGNPRTRSVIMAAAG